VVLSAGNYAGPGRMLLPHHVRNLTHGRSLRHPLGLLGGRGRRCRIVYRLDGLRSVYAGEPANKGDRLLERNVALGSATVFQSAFSRECFEQAKFRYPEPSAVIHNGVDARLFRPAASLPGGGRTVLASSSWSTNQRKGFAELVRFAELPGVEEVRHIGRWPAETPPGRVALLGERTEPEIAELLRQADFFLFPSRHDACSNAVLEALASGLPVLYHRSGGTVELCREETFGVPFAEVPDQEAAAAVLEAGLSRRAALREAVLAAREDFGFARCYERYLHFLEDLTAAPAGEAAP